MSLFLLINHLLKLRSFKLSNCNFIYCNKLVVRVKKVNIPVTRQIHKVPALVNQMVVNCLGLPCKTYDNRPRYAIYLTIIKGQICNSKVNLNTQNRLVMLRGFSLFIFMRTRLGTWWRNVCTTPPIKIKNLLPIFQRLCASLIGAEAGRKTSAIRWLHALPEQHIDSTTTQPTHRVTAYKTKLRPSLQPKE